MNLEEERIESLDLTVRSWWNCMDYGIRTIGELMKLSEEEIYYGIGKGSAKVYSDIVLKLAEYTDGADTHQPRPDFIHFPRYSRPQ